MIISTSWLADYVQLSASTDELVARLLMAGLNHESTRVVGADTAVEIEVTSNRPDCLGHIGLAREAAVLFGRPLHLPDPRPLEGTTPAARGLAVEIRAGDICPCYSARVLRGVRIGASPRWLVERLETVGVASVNNVVDVTNYVMLETGQPLHAFDLAKIRGGRVVVRRAVDGEPFTAINHKTYALDARMCVIADAERPVALAGVMGGADTEIGADTTDILLESAQFAPLPVRAAARGLVLSSGSSYRFERGPDPAMGEWASRRAAALILEIAGGTLDRGTVTAGRLACTPATVPLDPGRVGRVLGVDVPASRQRAILTGLGFVEDPTSTAERPVWRAPTWRRDVWREIDLVEEIARIEGYDRVPEDVAIAARPVEWSDRELTIRRSGEVLVAAGLCEALTRSVVPSAAELLAGPWTVQPPLVVVPALVRGADRLRRTLLPSLLEARAANAAVGTADAGLFEIARAYLARPAAAAASPPPTPLEEPLLAAFVTGGEFPRAKGIAAGVLARLGIGAAADGDARLEYRPLANELLAPGCGAEVLLHRPGRQSCRIGVVGEAAPDLLGLFGLQGPVAVAELRLDLLEFAARRERRLERPSDFPAVQRDINLVVAETVAWGAVEEAIQSAAGRLLDECRLVQVWQDAERLGPGRKSLVVALRLRSESGTLSGDEAARVVESIVAECGRRTGATLRG
ncbi:MAG: phenylalanine--tRNA ligase subunit beta [Planctomycetia bacterium]